MEIVWLETVDSTNNWLAENESHLPIPSLVYCDTQTAGRGQRGNAWESEPGKNITASFIFYPSYFPANKQFVISEAVALAVVNLLEELEVEAKIKWPNDIYVGDKKICGILVEHVVTGRNISRTIVGMGININQTVFKSDAPNPVSLSILTGKQYHLQSIVQKLSVFLEEKISHLEEGDSIHSDFRKHLWRGDGEYHWFYDNKLNRKIEAKIENVGTDGILSLKTREDEIRKYAFKEITFIL